MVCANGIQVRCKILFYRIPQFICESKSERIIEIGPHLPVIVKIKVAPFYGPRCRPSVRKVHRTRMLDTFLADTIDAIWLQSRCTTLNCDSAVFCALHDELASLTCAADALFLCGSGLITIYSSEKFVGWVRFQCPLVYHGQRPARVRDPKSVIEMGLTWQQTVMRVLGLRRSKSEGSVACFEHRSNELVKFNIIKACRPSSHRLHLHTVECTEFV